MGLIDAIAGMFRKPAPVTAAPIPAAASNPAPPIDWLVLCLPLTKASESCRLEAYPDPASGGDPWTIGWGATGPSIVPGAVWTQLQADADLSSRLCVIGRQIDSYATVSLSAQQKAALADLIYNIGIGNFESSTLLRKLNAGDFAGAAEQFLVWNIAAGKVRAGLVTRRARNRSLFLTGTWSKS
jgi:lysozyme